MITVAPSILSADFGHLSDMLDLISESTGHCHLDIMDGHFVPNITIGPPVVKSLRKHSELYFDCHLMIEEPSKYLEAFHDAGADLVTVHVEVGDTDSLLSQIKDLGMDVGLAINPDTPIEKNFQYLQSIDLLLIMSVFPGFGGQKFMPVALEKIRKAKEYRQRHGLGFKIEVDGGINLITAIDCVEAGADILVSGSTVFDSGEPTVVIEKLKGLG